MAEAAPFFAEVTEAPDGGRVTWRTCDDGVRVRIAVWKAGTRGTVLLFPGRTEYVEKYGPAAIDLAARGYSTATIDWRGQGLADRLLPDRATGHVARFGHYQRDVAALLAAVRDAEMPEPCFLLAHSMGGCIGLRAIHRRLPVRAVAFSGPMWGIRISTLLRPAAWALSVAGRLSGQGHRYAPGTTPETYVSFAPYADNMLTTDPGMYAFMQRQVAAHPGLSLGGPSLHWLHEALAETRALRALRPPALPCLTALGQRERIVDVDAVRQVMKHWPGAQLDEIAGAEHEVMMETPAIRAHFYDAVAALFDAHRAGG